MALLAKLIPDERGICDCYTYGTYGGGQIPRDRQGFLAFSAVLNEPLAPYTQETYERVVMLMTGSIDDRFVP